MLSSQLVLLSIFIIFKPCPMADIQGSEDAKKSLFSDYCLLLLIIEPFDVSNACYMFSRGCTEKYFLHISFQLGVLFLPSSFKQCGSVFSCTSNVTQSEVVFVLDMIELQMVREKEGPSCHLPNHGNEKEIHAHELRNAG